MMYNNNSTSTMSYSPEYSILYNQSSLFISHPKTLEKEEEDEKTRLESLPLFDPDDLDI